MDPTNFVIKTVTNIGKVVLSELKPMPTQHRAALDEATKTISPCECCNRNGIQQVVAPELEDAMARATAEVEDAGSR